MMSRSPPGDRQGNQSPTDSNGAGSNLYNTAKNLFTKKFSIKMGSKPKGSGSGDESPSGNNKFRTSLPGK